MDKIRLPVCQISAVRAYMKSVRSSKKVHDIKIRPQIQNTIPRVRQKLMFNGRRLEDDCPLSAYGIQQASFVHMMIHKNNDVIVKTLEGEKLFIDLDLCDTVKNMKVKIRDYNGIPVDQMQLTFAGKQLEDGRTASDYRITHLSTVHQVHSLSGGGGEKEGNEVNEKIVEEEEEKDEDVDENRGRSRSMENLADFDKQTPWWDVEDGDWD